MGCQTIDFKVRCLLQVHCKPSCIVQEPGQFCIVSHKKCVFWSRRTYTKHVIFTCKAYRSNIHTINLYVNAQLSTSPSFLCFSLAYTKQKITQPLYLSDKVFQWHCYKMGAIASETFFPDPFCLCIFDSIIISFLT